MTTKDENPVRGEAARIALGTADEPMSRTRYAAVKRLAGVSGHYVFVSVLRKALRDNPGFKVADIYHVADCKCEPCRVKRLRQRTEPSPRGANGRNHAKH